MSGDGDAPLFVDTSAFVGAYIEDDAHHDAAADFFEGLRSGESAYGAVYTTRYLLCETATVTSIQADHRHARTTVSEILDSGTVNLLPVTDATFSAACEAFIDSDETDISLFDHLSGVVANENGIDHVFAFDANFGSLGFTVLPDESEPRETGEDTADESP